MSGSVGVSVCIVSAGRPELAACLESLAAQSLPPAEVLVLVDSEPVVAKAMAERFPGVRVGVFSGLSLGAARNALATAAGGELLLFLDDDVVAPPHLMRSLVEVAGRHPDAGLFGGPNLTLPSVTGPSAHRFRPARGVYSNPERLILSFDGTIRINRLTEGTLQVRYEGDCFPSIEAHLVVEDGTRIAVLQIPHRGSEQGLAMAGGCVVTSTGGIP